MALRTICLRLCTPSSALSPQGPGVAGKPAARRPSNWTGRRGRGTAGSVHVARRVALSAFFVPPGHFYSPIADPEELSRRRETIFDRNRRELPGIDLRDDEQRVWFRRIAAYYADVPFAEEPSEGLRYWYANDQFRHGDAIVLFGMMRHLRPKRVVEVGSGYSSALMLDVNDRFLHRSVGFTFIDPYPQRLLSLTGAADLATHRVIESPVQEVPLDTFAELEAGDILFLDSSHVLKTGSDVAHLLFEVLPVLRDGVIVHFHDIQYPFEYPEVWVIRDERNWNEIYAVRAFLQYNTDFHIVYFSHYMALRHANAVRDAMPLIMKGPGGSLWLRKGRRQGLPARIGRSLLNRMRPAIRFPAARAVTGRRA